MYFSVERLGIRVVEGEDEGLMNVTMLYMGVEVELDRDNNTHVNMNIYKFLVEDD